jgi:hypothetical protein
MVISANPINGGQSDMQGSSLTDYELQNTSPKNAATTALFLTVAENYGEAAAKNVRPLLREHNLDPTSDDFDAQSFYRLVKDRMKA